MLQRIQSIWIFLAAVCAALTFKFPFYGGNTVVGTNGHNYEDLTATSSVLILVITVIIIGGSLVNIFNYKDRKKQLWITIGLIFLSLLNIVLYYRKTTPGHGFIEGNFAIWAVLTLAIPLFLILAVRGIMRDQKLVKSVDRLR
ncbi:MAG TPA: DUF4293 domain-containing protein [Puia sp.]|nr:DUF4293 domain-containing protein [Puia sp.]